MGTCFSSGCSEKHASVEKQQDEEKVVCVEKSDGLSPREKGKGRIGSLYSQQGEKGVNQDAAIHYQGFGTEDGVFCGVFDGHGTNGHSVSKLVRDKLPRLLLGQLNSSQQQVNDVDGEFTDSNKWSSTVGEGSSDSAPETVLDEWKEACVNAFRAMDEQLVECSHSGTTAVSIIKQGNDLIIANLGDSRAVLAAASDDGLLDAIQLTTDLKPSVPQEAERIRKHKGRVFALPSEPHVQRIWLPNQDMPGLAMARTFGDFQLKSYGVISVPQVSHRRLTSSDLFVVLATDGVWDVLSNEEVVSIVWESCKGDNKDDASTGVVKAARRAWESKFPRAKVDDCTAACVFLNQVPQLGEAKQYACISNKRA